MLELLAFIAVPVGFVSVFVVLAWIATRLFPGLPRW